MNTAIQLTEKQHAEQWVRGFFSAVFFERGLSFVESISVMGGRDIIRAAALFASYHEVSH
jgi:hypothetical protein